MRSGAVSRAIRITGSRSASSAGCAHLLRAEDCRDVVFIGALVRPALSEIRLDWGTLRVMPAVFAAFRGGDDHLLTGIGQIFERDGFRLLGLKDVAPDLLMPAGCMTRAAPDDDAEADIAKGRAVLAALSPFDIGQALRGDRRPCRRGRGYRRHRRMLQRVARLRGEGRLRAKPGSGVLVKAPKSGQDLRFDLPAIGPKTIEGVDRRGTCRPRGRRRPHRRRRAAGVDRAPPTAAGVFVIGVAARDAARPRWRARSSWSPPRNPATGSAPALMRALRAAARRRGAVRRRRRPGDGARGAGRRCFRSTICRSSGFAAVAQRLPMILRRSARRPTRCWRRRRTCSSSSTVRISPIAWRSACARAPAIPIVDYVSPSVWAWRPGRARAMRRYVDHVLALLPFEPAAHRRLAGRPAPMSAIR